MGAPRLGGVIAAAATPLNPDYSIDLPRLAAHCRELLQRGCDGINLLGTTGEATSFSTEQRLAAMKAIAEAGLPLERFMVGTGAAALEDAVRLTAAAREFGFAGALVLPPFYYKGIDDDGLVAFIATLIERVGKAGLRLYLYHFPQNSGVPYRVGVVERLYRSYPEQLIGLKDSSGDLEFSTELARRLPELDVFPSAEGTLAEAEERRFAGCISATVNVTAPWAAEAWRTLGSERSKRAIARAVAVRNALATFPLISCVKWALADLYGDAAWMRLCPPLRTLTVKERQELRAKLETTSYVELRAMAAGQSK